jgi:hypothetical protein
MKSPVTSITDEHLEEIEKAACRSYGETTIVSKQEVASIIARLRAAEADAKRYRWIKDCDGEHIDVVIENPGDGLDFAIDAAMERKP